MQRRYCAACGDDCGGDFRFCGACEGLKGQTVATPAGPARVVQLRPTGEFVVAPLDDSYCRQFRRSELGAIIDTQPAPIAAAVPEPPPARELEPLITADRTSDCAPLAPDLDPLAGIRRVLLARPFPAWALVPQPR